MNPKFWTDDEDAVIRRVVSGKMTREQAMKKLPNRSRESINKRVQRATGYTLPPRPVTALPDNDMGYEDGEWVERRIAAREGSARLLEAILRVREAA